MSISALVEKRSNDRGEPEGRRADKLSYVIVAAVQYAYPLDEKLAK